jgi:hypothetical protein
MRKIVSYLALTLCMNAPAIANGAFVIRLKNGNEYITNRYWQEGGQILFDADGGVFGIDKVFVKNIEKTDKVIKLVTTASQDPAERSQTEAANEISDDKEATAQAPAKKERAADDPIVGEFNRLTAKSKDVNGMLASEIRELLSEITALKNKIAKDSKLFIEYGREINDLHDTSNTVETALRSRTN